MLQFDMRVQVLPEEALVAPRARARDLLVRALCTVIAHFQPLALAAALLVRTLNFHVVPERIVILLDVARLRTYFDSKSRECVACFGFLSCLHSCLHFVWVYVRVHSGVASTNADSFVSGIYLPGYEQVLVPRTKKDGLDM